jgi:hypothetical protein
MWDNTGMDRPISCSLFMLQHEEHLKHNT